MRLPSSWYDSLHARLGEAMAREGLDALILDDPLDVAYVTGFVHFPNERPVVAYVPRDGQVLLLVPDLEREYAADQRAHAEIVVYPEFPGRRTPFEVLASTVSTVDNGGYSSSTSNGRVARIGAAFGRTQWRVSEIVGTARLRKTPEEVALHREAARIADAMLAAGVEFVRSASEPPTETELAAHVTGFGTRMMYAEHDEVVVVPMLTGGLVYGGANSAQPHRMPGGDRLRHGEPFMLSLGCAVGGRFVESERTFFLGEPTAEQARFYEVVKRAQEVGTAALRPGTACEKANNICLDVIREAGFGQYLRHRQGHGIGLGFHEPPWVCDGDTTILEPGMILSSEPGIYIPGHAGYRISDTVLVTEDGPVRLTAYPRDIEEVTCL